MHVPGTTKLRWQDIAAGPLTPDQRVLVVKSTRTCLKGPSGDRTPTRRATYYPINHCSCLAANMLATFSAGESAAWRAPLATQDARQAI